ncbi:unnamed protein product [Effrenium voratum]|uniref:UBC core domain-containing protein n=1 Tax=Effrenium voratum TaxID=2562239 RepID=A0AA36HYR7_9DINO|nr:unnamed protein product [Effrenium voratum]CAJ1376959.1 unnamed protein product [Effrenium voratum]CAJ1451758.1 unnamed protein product [Effrenium voratum]|mmetsp:Transcript_47551/g.113133  ORF Transcript_47551/g.113133 Transcript_47551/m.113133 type:complete len:167 (+) Transcript_47551:77-577(+)
MARQGLKPPHLLGLSTPQTPFSKRLNKELEDLKARGAEDGIFLHDFPDSNTCRVQVFGAPDTLYAGETFMLRFHFSDRYPFESPEVVFEGVSPMHPHIYSNGHICLSILYDAWSPALSVHAVCMSIVSMLSSAQSKVRPQDDTTYVARVGRRSPKLSKWHFDDDRV